MEKIKKYWYYFILGLIFVFGVGLRAKIFLSGCSLWHDECALAWSIKFKSYGDYFGILEYMQMAPPFFMVLTKLATKIFGLSDIMLHLLPFLAGCLSIIAFYFLAVKTLKNKPTVILALFLFVINQRLINYSSEFKPYSFDILFATICLLFFMNLDLEKLNAKKAFLYGALLSVIPWFSFTSVFIIAAGILNIFFKNIKTKNYFSPFTVFFLPLLISALIYLKIYLLNNYTGIGTGMVNYWQDSFLSANPLIFLSLLIENIRYFFHPMPYVLFPFILFFWGLGVLYKEKSEFFKIFIISFILLLSASMLHIYPFGTRLILFLLPMFLLIMLKPLDNAFGKKIKFIIAQLLVFFAFYFQIIAINYFIHTKNPSRGEYAGEMMKYMMDNIKKGDNIFVNSVSGVEFGYYSSFYNVKNNVIQEAVTNESEEKYTAFLNGLKAGYYWFYLPYDSSHSPVFKTILPWVKTKKVIYSIQKDRSVLLYVYIN